MVKSSPSSAGDAVQPQIEELRSHVSWPKHQNMKKQKLYCNKLNKDFTNQFSSVQSLNCVRLFATPWTAARQASLSITNSRSLLKFMSIELVMPSNHLNLVVPFSSCLQSYPAWGPFPMSIQGWLPLGLTGLISLLSKGLWRVFSSTTVQKHQFFSILLTIIQGRIKNSQSSLWSKRRSN